MAARRLLSSVCFAFILSRCAQGQEPPFNGNSERPQGPTFETLSRDTGLGTSTSSNSGVEAGRMQAPGARGSQPMTLNGELDPLGAPNAQGTARASSAIVMGSGQSGVSIRIASLSTTAAPSVTVIVEGNSNQRIIHAYTVSLRRRSDLTYFCAGVLISSRHVLTAAHCVDPSRPGNDNEPLVVVGSGFLSQTEGSEVQMIPTKATILHPDYPSNRFPDLAVVELRAAANQTPIQLPTRFLPRRGNILESIGWGRQSTTSGNADVVQVVAMRFLNKRGCGGAGGGIVLSHQICMGGKGPSTCNGDNGGPIILPGRRREEDILVGIVGDKHSCGMLNKPDKHTNIAPYLDWIKSIAGIP